MQHTHDRQSTVPSPFNLTLRPILIIFKTTTVLYLGSHFMLKYFIGCTPLIHSPIRYVFVIMDVYNEEKHIRNNFMKVTFIT